MKNLNYIIALSILFITAELSAQKKREAIQGTWQGTLTTPNGNLGLVLKIKAEEGAIAVKMDVPLQRAKDIAASKAWFRHDSLFVEFEKIMARYTGILKPGGTQVAGLWEQGGYSFPLLLELSDKVNVIKRSQEPVRPFNYHEEEVVFKNPKAGISLSGTLTWPKNKDNAPVAILISGSGPQNRDEELLGHKPFLVLADHLTKNGIAVLRFDDRGVEKSTGDFSAATSLDFSTDVEAAIAYLKTRKEINKKMIGLIGHSEGGMIAPLVASRSKDIHFIVLLAGPGIKGSELLALQSVALSEASGMASAEIEKNKVLNNKIYALASNNMTGVKDSISNLLKKEGLPEETIKMQVDVITTPWFRYFLTFDPATTLSKTKCPVLALNGGKDLQVPYKENLEGIEKNLKAAGNKNYKVKIYDNLNHLFQNCTKGLPSEYASNEETIAPEVLQDISEWILKLK